MICTGYNAHIMQLLDKNEILWKCILSDGKTVLSDFDNDQKDPWTRLKHYCNNNGLDIVEVRVMCPGVPEQEIYKDENGLSNIFIIRGMCKDLNDSSEQVYKYMCFGKLESDNKIHVKKFYWPEFKMSEIYEIRSLTEENEKLLYKKVKRCSEKCKCQKKEQI